jgi:hypothetical protein
VSKLASQWIELFRAGKYPQGEFTAADLDQVVANYNSSNPDFEEAPSTIGHPEGTAPAWGWWGELKREGATLLGKMKTVAPEFEDMVERKLFPKRSIGLKKRESGWNLDHVAWLGAKAPQVKALADCKFQDGSIEVEFEETSMTTAANEATFWEKLTAKIDELLGKKGEADPKFSEAQVKDLVKEAVVEAVKPIQEKLTASEAKFAESQQRSATADVKTRVANAIAKLKQAGKWVPAFDKMGVPVLFEELAKSTETVEFGEAGADGKREKKEPFDLLLEFMDKHGRIVPNSEIYRGQQASGSTERGMKGVNPGSVAVDANSVRLHEATAKFAEENKVDYATAQMRVIEKHPELGRMGNAAAGQV